MKGSTKLNVKSIACLGFVFLFASFNFFYVKNYYDLMYSHYTYEDNMFEENLKKENSLIRSPDQVNLETQETEEIKPLKLNSLSALLMDGE
ncbi:MAG: hypothetical protein GX271_05800, partial [Clostridiales bacterium]|nr:hypothetical protein [Clostridiales bacterium]